jgi:peptidoglycan/LPS O-acetylase OafA/YrhL
LRGFLSDIPITDSHKDAHRFDIDGLRAVAVLLVILFHTGASRFSGGFIGVDIFFVISGYLITGIIVRDLSRGSFSLGKFYERRVRRIVPALLGILFACCIGCYLLFLPQDLVRFAQSLFAALFSYSNIYFWTQAGYFKPAYSKALLHTWSLGVEEQFYLFLPLTLFALRKRLAVIPWILLSLTTVSFCVSEWLVLRHEADTAFYMPFTRAWELFLGALLALDLLRLPKSRLMRDCVALVGILLIAVAAIYYKAQTPFPGAAALLPCLGTVLLLASGAEGGTFCAKMLSLRPLVFIGVISYSVYLWNLPLVTFARMGGVPGVTNKTVLQKIVVLAASLLFGWLSWRFVELPFRASGPKKVPRRQLFITAAGAAAAISAIGAIFLAGGGLPQRFPAEAVRVASFLDTEQEMRIGSCFITSGNHFSDYKQTTCTSTDPGLQNYLLIGDSHAAAFWFGLSRELKNARILEATASGCAPTLGAYDDSDCGQMRRYVYESLLPRLHVDGVILTEDWLTRTDVERIEPAIHWLQDHKIPVIIVGPVQEYDAPLPMLLAFSIKRSQPTLPQSHVLSRVGVLDRELQDKAAKWHVVYLSPWQESCGTGNCLQYADEQNDVPMLIDTNHLTNKGSELLVRGWVESGLFADQTSIKSNRVPEFSLKGAPSSSRTSLASPPSALSNAIPDDYGRVQAKTFVSRPDEPSADGALRE